MKKNAIVHIVSWYPTSENPNEAIWTKRHIQSLVKHADNFVFHIQVKKGKFKRKFEKISDTENRYHLHIPTEKWIVKEIFTTLLLLYIILFKTKRHKPDFYNFQITYPLLSYSKLVCFFARKPIIVTEHWSAYHYNFGVAKKPKRIQRIFKNKRLRFITVSEALATDITNFAETSIKYKVIPNIVDTSIFHQGSGAKSDNTYLMVSYWKSPKDPFIIFDAISKITLPADFRLLIIGDGPLLDEMKAYIKKINIQDVITFTGRKDSVFIAQTLQSVSYLIHCSEYETASVVCMESLCCGTPIIASKVGGIPEYAHDKNSIMVSENSVEIWSEKIQDSLNQNWKNYEIAKEASTKWNSETVGLNYYNALING